MAHIDLSINSNILTSETLVGIPTGVSFDSTRHTFDSNEWTFDIGRRGRHYILNRNDSVIIDSEIIKFDIEYNLGDGLRLEDDALFKDVVKVINDTPILIDELSKNLTTNIDDTSIIIEDLVKDLTTNIDDTSIIIEDLVKDVSTPLSDLLSISDSHSKTITTRRFSYIVIHDEELKINIEKVLTDTCEASPLDPRKHLEIVIVDDIFISDVYNILTSTDEEVNLNYAVDSIDSDSKDFHKVLEDSITLSDTFNTERGRYRNLYDSITVFEESSKLVTKSISSYVVNDEELKLDVNKTLSDILEASTVNIQKDLNKLTEDLIVLLDDNYFNIQIVTVDTIILSDSYSFAWGKELKFNDNVISSDDLYKLFDKLSIDNQSVNDVVIKGIDKGVNSNIDTFDFNVKLLELNVEDTTIPFDSYGTGNDYPILDIITVSDDIILSVEKVISDIVTISDNINFTVDLNITSVGNIVDDYSIESSISKARSINDNATPIDSLSFIRDTFIKFEDSDIVADSISKTLHKYLADSIVSSDTITKDTNRILSDITSNVDSISKTTSLFKVDDVNILEDYNFTYTVFLIDTVSNSDEFYKLVERLISSEIIVEDSIDYSTFYTLDFNDIGYINDNYSVLINLNVDINLNDTVNLIEDLKLDVSKVFADTVNVEEEISKLYNVNINDTGYTADSLVKFIGRVNIDSLTTGDTLTKDISATLIDVSETIDLLDGDRNLIFTNVVTTNDNISKFITITIDDQIELIDVISKGVGLDLYNHTGSSETFVKVIGKNISDLNSIISNFKFDVEFNLSDLSVNFDTIDAGGGVYKIINDVVEVSETIDLVWTKEIVIEDIVEAESDFDELDTLLNIDDEVELTDSGVNLDGSLEFEDVIVLEDSGKQLEADYYFFEVSHISDNNTRESVISRLLNDTVGSNDTVYKYTTKHLTDTVATADTNIKLITAILSDTVSINEDVYKLISKFTSDTITLTDGLVKLYSKNISDSGSSSDVSIIAGNNALEFNDYVWSSDDYIIEVIRNLNLNDTTEIVEDIVKSVDKSTVDSVNSSDIFNKDIRIRFNEISILDSNIYKLSQIIFGDNIEVNDDQIESDVAVVISLSDTVLISDSLIKFTTKYLSDSVSITDQIIKYSNKFLIDNSSISDNTAKDITKITVDITSIEDSIIKDVIKVNIDTVNSNDDYFTISAENIEINLNSSANISDDLELASTYDSELESGLSVDDDLELSLGYEISIEDISVPNDNISKSVDKVLINQIKTIEELAITYNIRLTINDVAAIVEDNDKNIEVLIESTIESMTDFIEKSINVNFEDTNYIFDNFLYPHHTGLCIGLDRDFKYPDPLYPIITTIPNANMNEFSEKVKAFYVQNEVAINCLFQKYHNEQDVNGKSSIQYNIYIYHILFQVVATMWVEMGWNLQTWNYFKSKYDIDKFRRFANCYDINFDAILTLFNINPKLEYQTQIYKYHKLPSKKKVLTSKC